MPALTVHHGGGQVYDLRKAAEKLGYAWEDLADAIERRIEGRGDEDMQDYLDMQGYLDRVQTATRYANALVDRALAQRGV